MFERRSGEVDRSQHDAQAIWFFSCGADEICSGLENNREIADSVGGISPDSFRVGEAISLAATIIQR